jgi:hypothetical protein
LAATLPRSVSGAGRGVAMNSPLTGRLGPPARIIADDRCCCSRSQSRLASTTAPKRCVPERTCHR